MRPARLVYCPKCKRGLDAPTNQRHVRCPSCGKEFVVKVGTYERSAPRAGRRG